MPDLQREQDRKKLTKILVDPSRSADFRRMAMRAFRKKYPVGPAILPKTSKNEIFDGKLPVYP